MSTPTPENPPTFTQLPEGFYEMPEEEQREFVRALMAGVSKPVE